METTNTANMTDTERETDTEEANALEDAGHFREALVKWKEIVAREADAISLCRLGRVASRLNEWAEAEKALLRSIAAAPEWSLPHEALGLLYRDKGELSRAEVYFKQSLALRKQARTLMFLGDVLDRVGRNSEAKALLREAIALDPASEEAYYLLAVAAGEDAQEAIPLYEQAVTLDPGYSLAHRDLGWVLRRVHRLDEAEAHLRTAIRLNEGDAWSFIYLGNTLWARGDLSGAEVAFRRGISVAPDCAAGYWCLADLAKYQGRLSEARHLLKAGLRANIASVEASIRFALLLKDVGDFARARRYLRRALRLDPTNLVARSLLEKP